MCNHPAPHNTSTVQKIIIKNEGQSHGQNEFKISCEFLVGVFFYFCLFCFVLLWVFFVWTFNEHLTEVFHRLRELYLYVYLSKQVSQKSDGMLRRVKPGMTYVVWNKG